MRHMLHLEQTQRKSFCVLFPESQVSLAAYVEDMCFLLTTRDAQLLWLLISGLDPLSKVLTEEKKVIYFTASFNKVLSSLSTSKLNWQLHFILSTVILSSQWMAQESLDIKHFPIFFHGSWWRFLAAGCPNVVWMSTFGENSWKIQEKFTKPNTYLNFLDIHLCCPMFEPFG